MSEDQPEIKKQEESCPPKTIKQIEQCFRQMSDCAKATKEENSSSTKQK
jgi:hypothetical protein